ncbi:NAD(P)-binding domain-containing protein [Myxococcus sp. MxC21-1]|nr:NAD(P)-binding domain-containing protein [Myxococcus sp. MxC21-1]WNZ58871.1 NAD(P)-binding domain-containing protein [Myxococcus sp. MxC21-1]
MIVGMGRLGGALGLALQAKRWPVRIHSRTDEGRERAEALGLKTAAPADLKRARVILLCVPDAAVPAVAQALSTTLPARPRWYTRRARCRSMRWARPRAGVAARSIRSALSPRHVIRWRAAPWR